MVSNPSAGLRFDIYERVHLPDGVAGIKELDEIELVPNIQVLSRDDQAILKGSLVLTGKYAGEGDEQGTRTLSHHIPVEITLPIHRVERIEEIGVDIENFDIDLISSRSLNVTGVLSLRGIETGSGAADRWQEEEELVFVHEVPSANKRDEQSPVFEPVNDWLPSQSEPTRSEPTEAAEKDESFITDVEVDTIEAAEETEAETFDSLEGTEFEEQADEKKEMKIAFGSKTSEQAAQSKSSDLLTLLHKPPFDSRADTRNEFVDDSPEAEYTEETFAAKSGSTGDALEWKNLFINPDAEQQFRRLKMCIVQKEETIDSIAERYQLNPRELILFNRLGEQSISEGQVLYIPK